MQTFLFAAITMTAFAANSILARLALGDDAIDPASYTFIRIASGAVILGVLAALQGGSAYAAPRRGNWISALALLAYAAGFSFAYLALDTGTGALILFACVQATMIGWSLARGDRPLVLEWAGLAAAFAAFVWLVLPGIGAPEPWAAALMMGAGIAWGIYSLRGAGSADPLAATAGNFIFATPVALALLVAAVSQAHMNAFGLAMAVLSGSVASGLGYALWYRTLRDLTGTQAAIVQLTVPVIAAAGGIAFRGEPLTARFVIASIVILGGVAVAILARQRRS